MSTVKFKRKTTEEIENLNIEDGSIIFDTKARNIYLDNGEERLAIGGGVSREYVDNEILSTKQYVNQQITGALEASY